MKICDCIGEWCTCVPGTRVAKDGTTVRVPLIMKDSAMSDTPTMDTMPTASMTLDQALALPRYQRMGGQARQHAMRDLALAAAAEGSQRTEAYRDHYQERMSNAWMAPAAVNDNKRPDPVIAKDGRPFAQLTDSEKARERMQRDQSEAWKG